MTPIADILAGMTPAGEGFEVDIPTDWAQGRTTYGGLTSALALEVATRSVPDLPPLRSAQVAFIGPLSGRLAISARLLRRGRTAAFVGVDVQANDALGFRAVLVFMAASESSIDHDAREPAPLPPPPADVATFIGSDTFFIGNFELDARRPLAAGAPRVQRWLRLRAREGLDPMTAVVAVADALPPAVVGLTGDMSSPVSSVTWQLNLLTPTPTTQDGWWLLRSETERATGGGSSQRMAMWNTSGGLVAEGMQSVVIFG